MLDYITKIIFRKQNRAFWDMEKSVREFNRSIMLEHISRVEEGLDKPDEDYYKFREKIGWSEKVDYEPPL